MAVTYGTIYPAGSWKNQIDAINSKKGTANGFAELDATGKVPTSQLPSQHVLPSGGSSGQVLTKNSGTDYDVEWATPSGGGDGSVIDDNSGEGDTDVTWSANKIHGEFELQVGNINALLATI